MSEVRANSIFNPILSSIAVNRMFLPAASCVFNRDIHLREAMSHSLDDRNTTIQVCLLNDY